MYMYICNISVAVYINVCMSSTSCIFSCMTGSGLIENISSIDYTTCASIIVAKHILKYFMERGAIRCSCNAVFMRRKCTASPEIGSVSCLFKLHNRYICFRIHYRVPKH